MMSGTINILMIASEADPFIKIGGLADVAGSLPLALRSLTHQALRGVTLDVRLALPLHRSIPLDGATLVPSLEFTVSRNGEPTKVKVYQSNLAGMPVYFLGSEIISQAERVYDFNPGQDRDKYGLFSMAVLRLMGALDWKVDILHANDWHTAMAVYALRTRRIEPIFENVRTVLTLHNLPYMGGDGRDTLKMYGLPPLENQDVPEWARTFLLPLGLWAADAIIPVSPTYGREILSSEFGCGLETFLLSRAESITGILNGIETKSNDPETDGSIPNHFTFDKLEPRILNKVALQKAVSLPQNARLPILAMVGRIDQQKGLDLAFEALRRCAGKGWQFVLLGSGDPTLESLARNLQTDYPDRVRVNLRYDHDLGKLIYAGADIFLMPSRYEPCGLAQMYAMRYGCVPVVRATGGLRDTVEEGRTGFVFQAAEAEDLVAAIERALEVYETPAKWQRYQRAGMQEDFSWNRSARQYAMIYRALVSE